MQRITFKDLRAQAKELNEVTKSPVEYGQAGHFYIGAAYGGYQLCRICKSGGHENITGFGTARETSNRITGMLAGVNL